MRRGTILAAIVGLAVLLGAAYAGQRLLGATDEVEPAAGSRRPDAPTSPTTAPTPEAPEPAGDPVTMTVLEPGTLEREGADGQWQPLPAGTALVETDRVRTVGSGRAVIQASDGSRVELVDAVDVAVATLTRSIAELDLRQGRLRADLRDGSELALRVRSSGAVAEGRGGAFTIYADGAGMVAVASETAEVSLRAQDREVALAEGQQSVVHAGEAPADPEAIPEEVLLAVTWPEQRILDAGANTVGVSTRDPAGRTRTSESPTIVVRNRPPRLERVHGSIWDE